MINQDLCCRGLSPMARLLFAQLAAMANDNGGYIKIGESCVDLQAAIKRYIEDHNDDPKPFTWTKSAKAIIKT